MASDLTPEETALLVQGLGQWGGPVRMSDAIAVAIGFESAAAVTSEPARIIDLVQTGDALGASDARRALLATEIMFASDVIGAGVEWETVTGMPDAQTLDVLRRLQRKLIRHHAGSEGS